MPPSHHAGFVAATAPLAAKARKSYYGWKPDLPDERDHGFTARRSPGEAPPLAFSLLGSPNLPPIWDQGSIGSCTAHGAAACFEFALRKQGLADYTPSRLFLYYAERALDGTVSSDSGSTIRQSMKVLSTVGAPHEALWPYAVGKLTTTPSGEAWADALSHRCVKYMRVPHGRQSSLMAALADGYPVTFGFTVYDSFESDAVAQTGMMPMPARSEAVLGGHCVAAIGYDHTKGVLCRNSWGTDWGIAGHFWMPWAFITGRNATDFWAVRTVA